MTGFDIPSLTSDRLILRAPRVEDFGQFKAFLRSDRTGQIGGPVTEVSQSWRLFEAMAGTWVLRGFGPFVWAGRDGVAVGHGGAWFDPAQKWPELGWCLWSARVEGQGYATEAMKRIIGWYHLAAGLPRLWAGIRPDHHASLRLAARLGGRLDATGITPDGEAVPCYWFESART